ncbi:hypothetical protein D9M68_996270 [compost metagenome]
MTMQNRVLSPGLGFSAAISSAVSSRNSHCSLDSDFCFGILRALDLFFFMSRLMSTQGLLSMSLSAVQ